MPLAGRPEATLEFYLMGGLCPWDTFYVVPEFGKPSVNSVSGEQWWTFQQGKDSVPEVFERCGGGDRPLLEPFATDAAGRTVQLGPWVWPLRARPDILSRMRVFVMSHAFQPHDSATPYALCGQPRGTARMAATGAHVQRHHMDTGAAERQTPYSYVLYASTSEIEAQFDIHSASASGMHPAYARPLMLRMLRDDPLLDQLARKHFGSSERAKAFDRAIAHYVSRAQSSLTPIGGKPVWSRAFAEYAAARNSVANTGRLESLLTPSLLAPSGGSQCGSDVAFDSTVMSLRIATHLITSPIDPAKSVTVIDSGLINATGAGYDTHEFHVVESSRNVMHALTELTNRINRPGEGDPTKIDLDRHLVLLTTEFGRTPTPERGKPLGLDHWPFGYVVVAFGAWADADRRGIVGAIGPDARATQFITPGEFRAAMLLGQGIWPFEPEAFAVGDVRGATSESHAAELLLKNVLGRAV